MVNGDVSYLPSVLLLLPHILSLSLSSLSERDLKRPVLRADVNFYTLFDIPPVLRSKLFSAQNCVTSRTSRA